jgi:O-antigen/teichoic acid export membrane protein
MRSIRNTALNLFTSVGMTVIQILIGAILNRTVGPGGRGEMQTVTMWALLLSWAVGLSFGQANAYKGAADPERRPALFANSLWLALFIGIPCGLAASAILPHYVHLTDENRFLFLFSLWALPISMLSDYYGWLLYSDAKFGKFNLFRITPQLVVSVSLLLLWAFHLLTVRTAILATWTGSYVALGYAIVMLVRAGYGRLKPDWALAKDSLIYSSKVHLGTLANAANGRLDQLLMSTSVMITTHSLGLYVCAVTYSELLNQTASAISLVLFPKVAAEKDPAKQAEHAAMSVRWTLIIGALGGLFLFFAAPVIVPLINGASFMGAIPAIHWLLPGIVAMGVCAILSASLRGAGKPGLTSIAEGVSVTVMLTLLLALLPRLGIVGASVASTCGYFVNMLVLIYFFKREFGGASIASMRPTGADIVYARNAIVNFKRRKGAVSSEAAPL